MAYVILEYEPTPNPNAMKCWLDRPISDRPRSFRTAADASNDPIAWALFEQAGVTNVLLCGDWLTVNKEPDVGWPAVKKKVASVLASAAESGAA